MCIEEDKIVEDVKKRSDVTISAMASFFHHIPTQWWAYVVSCIELCNCLDPRDNFQKDNFLRFAFSGFGVHGTPLC